MCGYGLIAAGMLFASDNPGRTIAEMLDAWHLAAEKANEQAYFSRIAEDGVFLGTDAAERWSKAEFQRYAHPYFAKGKAWTFKARNRRIQFSPDGKTAWFDELLDTEKMGVCRGSGVVFMKEGTWLIVQYNLSIPIPNEALPGVRAVIDAHEKRTPASK